MIKIKISFVMNVFLSITINKLFELCENTIYGLFTN